MRKRNTFRPTDIGGCQLWLDGADPAGTGIIPVAGSTITTWADKSGNGNSATAYGTVTADTLLNGKFAMSTTSTSGFFGYLTNSGTTATTFAVATLTNGSPGYSRLFAASTGTNADYSSATSVLFACTINSGTQIGAYYNSPSVTALCPGTLTTNQPFMITTLFSGTQCIINLTGAPTSASPTSQSTSFGYTYYGIGTHANAYGSVGECWAGIIAEVIHFPTALSRQEYQQVESYLAQKWGLRQQLPQGHPGTTGIVYSQQSIPKAIYWIYPTYFNPLTIAGCTLWLDAIDSSNFTFNGTSNIIVWNDKSGSNYSLSNTSGSVTYQPYFYTYNSRPTVHFDGAPSSSNVLSNTTFPIALTNMTIFIVYQELIASSLPGVLVVYPNPLSGTDYINGFLIHSGNGSSTILGLAGGSGSSAGTNLVGTVPTAYSLWTVTNTANSLVAYQNGSAWGNVTMGFTGTNTGIALGTSYASGALQGSASCLNGNISEILFYTRGLNTSERQKIEAYLAWKWGLQGSLAGDNPNKGISPNLTNPAGISRPNVFPIPSIACTPKYSIQFAIPDFTYTSNSIIQYGEPSTWQCVASGLVNSIQNGIYTTTGSHFYKGDYNDGVNPVDGNASGSLRVFRRIKPLDASGGWLSRVATAPNYNNTGTFSGGTSMTISGSAVNGEYITINAPYSFILNSYTLVTGNRTGPIGSWVIGGSTDGGTTWTTVDTQTSMTIVGNTITINLPSNTSTYSSYIIVVTALPSGGNARGANIDSWNLFTLL